jgi:multidrug resistance efflux pump
MGESVTQGQAGGQAGMPAGAAPGAPGQPAASAAPAGPLPPTPTPGRPARRRVILPVLIVGLLAILAVVAYYYVQGSLYVSTDDANVAGNVVYIYPPAAGTLSTWTASLSEPVQAGTVLGSITAPSGATAPGASPSVGIPVTAPLAGVIVENDGVVGEQVAPTLGTPLAAEIDLRNLWIVANVAETSIGRVRVGQRVDVTVDALAGHTFACSVSAIQQATQSVFSLLPADQAGSTFTKVTQKIPVTITCPDTAGWTPGGDAEVRIHVG